MPSATNKGIRIHYTFEGSGTPLVLVDGLTLLDAFRESAAKCAPAMPRARAFRAERS